MAILGMGHGQKFGRERRDIALVIEVENRKWFVFLRSYLSICIFIRISHNRDDTIKFSHFGGIIRLLAQFKETRKEPLIARERLISCKGRLRMHALDLFCIES